MSDNVKRSPSSTKNLSPRLKCSIVLILLKSFIFDKSATAVRFFLVFRFFLKKKFERTSVDICIMQQQTRDLPFLESGSRQNQTSSLCPSLSLLACLAFSLVMSVAQFSNLHMSQSSHLFISFLTNAKWQFIFMLIILFWTRSRYYLSKMVFYVVKINYSLTHLGLTLK